jgi:DNA-binding Lrp family transcriptional regulator
MDIVLVIILFTDDNSLVLDRTDKVILKIPQKNGRISNADLAD